MTEIALREIGLDPASTGRLPQWPRRDARLPQFLGLRGDPGAILDSFKAAVIGVGSVGRSIAVHLARQQIGSLWCIDPGHFKPESLLTQPIGPGEVGQPKASSAGRLCKQISPRTRVRVQDGPVEALDLTALADVDLVVLATDRLSAEVEVGQRCLYLGKPLVQASVHGDTLVALVRFYGNAGGDRPCPACGFDTAEWAHLNRETIFSCQGGADAPAQPTAPTMSVSFLCSLAADLALVQIERHLLGLGAPVTDTLLEYCGYTHRSVTTPLKRNPLCPCEHLAWIERPALRPLADCAPCDLTAAAALAADALPEEGSFLVADLAYAEQGVCAGCGRLQDVCQFIGAGPRIIRCCNACGGELKEHPFYTYRPVPAAVLRPVFDWPLGRLGAGSARWVVVRGGDRQVLFRQAVNGEGKSP